MKSKGNWKKCKMKKSKKLKSSTTGEDGEKTYLADKNACDDGEKLTIKWVTPEPSCADDATWVITKGGDAADCAWVAAKPEKRCTKRGDDGRRAEDACLGTCGGCG